MMEDIIKEYYKNHNEKVKNIESIFNDEGREVGWFAEVTDECKRKFYVILAPGYDGHDYATEFDSVLKPDNREHAKRIKQELIEGYLSEGIDDSSPFYL